MQAITPDYTLVPLWSHTSALTSATTDNTAAASTSSPQNKHDAAAAIFAHQLQQPHQSSSSSAQKRNCGTAFAVSASSCVPSTGDTQSYDEMDQTSTDTGLVICVLTPVSESHKHMLHAVLISSRKPDESNSVSRYEAVELFQLGCLSAIALHASNPGT